MESVSIYWMVYVWQILIAISDVEVACHNKKGTQDTTVEKGNKINIFMIKYVLL